MRAFVETSSRDLELYIYKLMLSKEKMSFSDINRYILLDTVVKTSSWDLELYKFFKGQL